MRPTVGARLVLYVLIGGLAGTACSEAPDTWAGIRNPVLGFPDVAIKDAFLSRLDQRWFLGYSELREDPFRARLGFASSDDLRSFEAGETIDQLDTGGLASPDVVRLPSGGFVMTYNSHYTDVGDSLSKLYYRTSMDLRAWSEPVRIHVEGADADGDRLIDVALAFADAGVFLFFKREQTATVAYSASGSLDGPWRVLGDLSQPNLENYQLLRIDGRWHMMATTIPLLHAPVLLRLDGDERDPRAWLTWTVVRELEVPEQSWNSGPLLDHEAANAAYLLDERATDGYAYLLYAGSGELSSFNGLGHARLGLARSRDLETWEAAPEP